MKLAKAYVYYICKARIAFEQLSRESYSTNVNILPLFLKSKNFTRCFYIGFTLEL